MSTITNSSEPIFQTRPKTRNQYTSRLIKKSGRLKISRLERNWHRIIYFHDLANTLRNGNPKWGLLLMCFCFFATWLVFGLLWMLVGADNGDLDADDRRCLSGIETFAGYLLFSIETQTTIGYGSRYITHYCPEAVLLLCVQILAGVCVGGLLIQCVYERFHGPAKPHSNECFTEKAVICQRNGHFCLVFRVRDINGRYQCQNQIGAYLIHKTSSSEQPSEILLKSITLERSGILIWPIEIVHWINKSSPFWNLSAKDLIMKRFEIVVSMEGTSLSTSSTTQLSCSYLNREILWGHVFATCVHYDKHLHCYTVDHSLFNATKEVTMPLCSFKRLLEVQKTLMTPNRRQLPSLSTSSSPDLSDRPSDSGISSLTMSPIAVHHQYDASLRHSDEMVRVLQDTGRDNRVEPLFICLEKFLLENNKNNGDFVRRFQETAL